MTSPPSPETAPLDPDVARRAAAEVMDLPGADAVEVVVAASVTGLTRFASSEIIQNTSRRELQIDVRVVVGDRVASAATNQLDAEHLRTTGARAVEAAAAARPDPQFPGLPKASEVGRAKPVYRWDETTAETSPAGRAAAVGTILASSAADNVAGMYETSAHSYSIVSSEGIDCHDAYTRAVATCLVDLGDSTGWNEASTHSASLLDLETIGRRARTKADDARSPVGADPGIYEVVLEEPAVGVLLDYMAYSGFGAKQVIEGESFLAERAGEQVAAPLISIRDDVWHPGSVGLGFDLEGVPKTPVTVIGDGVALGPVTDLRTSESMNIANTGHFSGSSQFGPYAANVVMVAGDKSLEELVAGVDNGILVTRFHYVNILDRPATLLTGMTRDGTFRIRGGEVAGAVHNFRFAESVLSALASARGVGRDLVAFAPEFGSFGSTVVPALHLGEFRFASATSH